MLNWLKGGPSATYASEDAVPASGSNGDEYRHGNVHTTPQDEDEFTDTSSEGEDTSSDDQPPQTPAPMFALKAIRTVVWGTPAPPKPRERPARRKRRSPKSKKAIVAEKEDNKKETEPPVSKAAEKYIEQPTITRLPRLNKSLDPIPFKISQKPNLFDPSSSNLPAPIVDLGTPVRPSSPTKGILMTPGTSLRGKKAVSFHPSIGQTTPPPRNSHIRSGLPHEFPGKFPSPWTPRTGTPQHKRSISVPGPSSPSRTLTFEDGPLNLDKGKTLSLDKGKRPEKSTASNPTGCYEVGEESRLADYLDDSDDERAGQQLQREVSMHEDGNFTADMDAPRSSSGKFWKERTQKIEDAALEKVERLKARCKIATGYAKKKDEVCVELAERMRELVEKNRRLKLELKRLNQQSESAAGNFAFTRSTSSRATGHGSHALEEAMHAIEERDEQIAALIIEKARMDSALHENKQRAEKYEELLNTREDKIAELSMSMYHGDDDEDLEDVVADLKKKLRTAKQEARELSLARMEARGLREKVESLEQAFIDITAEKERAERELDMLKVDDGELTQGTPRRSITEIRLRQQIDDLEKSKRDLRTELREKTLIEAKERRELERKTRNELADLKGKVSLAGREKEKLEREIKDLKEYATRLEKELETTKKDNDDLKKKLVDQNPAGNDNAREWQTKQRTTLQELRKVKEETSTLRVQKGDIEEQLKSARRDIEELKVQLDSLSAKPATATPETKELESASDDSAVDRSFDRWTKLATASAADVPTTSAARSKSPVMTRTTAASTFALTGSPPVPTLANRQKRLFSAELAQRDNSDILPAPPDLSTFMQTPKAAERQDDHLFYQQRRQRESPRAKIVNLATTPPTSTTTPAGGRKVSGVGKVIPRRVTSGSAATRLNNMDPARRAAAEKRLAERKQARLGNV